MNAPLGPTLSRRALLRGGGALIVSFSMSRPPPAALAARRPRISAKLAGQPRQVPVARFAWIRIDADGAGHGLHRQGRTRPGHQDRASSRSPPRNCAVALRRRSISSPPTPSDRRRGLHRRQPFDGGQRHRDPARGRAGAHHPRRPCRPKLRRAGAAPARGANGASSPATARTAGYGELVAGDVLHVAAPAADRTCAIRRPTPSWASRSRRFDIPAIVTGGAVYVQDLRHGRDGARPRRAPAELRRAPHRASILAAVESPAGRSSRWCATAASSAVVAEREFQAILALRALSSAAAHWDTSGRPCRTQSDHLRMAAAAADADGRRIQHVKASAGSGERRLECDLSSPIPGARLDRPVVRRGLLDDGKLTVWTHTQGVYPAARRHRRDCSAIPKAQVRLHPCRRRRLLRPQRRRRRGRRRRADRPRACPAGPCACSGCARTSTAGSRSARP